MRMRRNNNSSSHNDINDSYRSIFENMQDIVIEEEVIFIIYPLHISYTYLGTYLSKMLT